MGTDSPHPSGSGPERSGWVDDEPALLTSTDSAVDSRLLEGSLRQAGIPYDMKMHNDKGITRVFMGTSPLGADFYVPSRLLAHARECIPGAEQPEGAAPARPPAPEPPPDRRRHPLAAAVTALALVGALLALYSLDAVLEWFRRLLGF